MEHKDFEERLTESAKKGLSRVVYDYENEIIKEAFSIAVLNHSEEEISLNNVLDAVKSLQKRLENKAVLEEDLNESKKNSIETINTIKRNRKERKRNILNLSLLFIGIIYIFWGLSLKKQYNDDELSDITILVGLIASSLSAIMVLVRSFTTNINKERKRTNDVILKLWSQIDYYGNTLYRDFLIGNVSIMPKDKIGNINSYIDLVNLLFNEDEQEVFSKLLEVRNKIVHGDLEDIGNQEKEKVISNAIIIIEKLKDLVKSDNPNATISFT